MYAVQGKAEVLALAKRMLRRKDKESIVDAAYNRYAVIKATYLKPHDKC